MASEATAAPKVTPRTASTEIVLQTTDLVAGYIPGVNILNGCNVYVAKGELVGIIGPNGAGKSTLLKAIFGQVNIRSGEVLLNGDDITGLKADKLVARGGRLRAPEQQRLPEPHDRREPRDGRLPQAQAVQRAPRVRGQPVPRTRQAPRAAGGLPLRR